MQSTVHVVPLLKQSHILTGRGDAFNTVKASASPDTPYVFRLYSGMTKTHDFYVVETLSHKLQEVKQVSASYR